LSQTQKDIGGGPSGPQPDQAVGRRFDPTVVSTERGGGVLTVPSLFVGPTGPAGAGAEDDSLDPADPKIGQPHPPAPAPPSRFAFLIGRWRCEATVRSANGEWQTLYATWLGRFILDGYAIADEYRMTGPTGKLIVLGMNLRTYDATKQSWNMKWLNALAG